MNESTCDPTRCYADDSERGKRIFSTEAAAMERHAANLKNYPNTSPQRAYPCPGTNHWHLTTIKESAVLDELHEPVFSTSARSAECCGGRRTGSTAFFVEARRARVLAALRSSHEKTYKTLAGELFTGTSAPRLTSLTAVEEMKRKLQEQFEEQMKSPQLEEARIAEAQKPRVSSFQDGGVDVLIVTARGSSAKFPRELWSQIIPLVQAALEPQQS
jgi:hypothetical protein